MQPEKTRANSRQKALSQKLLQTQYVIWLSTQSHTNPSPHANSLIFGNLQGISEVARYLETHLDRNLVKDQKITRNSLKNGTGNLCGVVNRKQGIGSHILPQAGKRVPAGSRGVHGCRACGSVFASPDRKLDSRARRSTGISPLAPLALAICHTGFPENSI